MLEVVIIFLSILLLASIYAGLVFLQVHYLKKSILSLSDSLQLQLRHLNDLLFFSEKFPKEDRERFLKSKTTFTKLQSFHQSSSLIKSLNHKSYPALYLDLLSLIHSFNQSFFTLNKFANKFQYKVAIALLFKDFKKYKALSST